MDACVVVVGRRAGTVRFDARSGEAKSLSVGRAVIVNLFICSFIYLSVYLLVFIYSLLKVLSLTLIIADGVS